MPKYMVVLPKNVSWSADKANLNTSTQIPDHELRFLNITSATRKWRTTEPDGVTEYWQITCTKKTLAWLMLAYGIKLHPDKIRPNYHEYLLRHPEMAHSAQR